MASSKECVNFMSKDFVKRFFHTRGKCSQGAECRFSHEPLTDLTKQLLDQAIQRDNHLKEMAKKAQLADSGQLEKSEEKMTINDPKPDILLHPIRPNFYNSSCPTETGESTMTEPDTVPQHVTDVTLTGSTPLSNLNCSKPVPYSVEAVLGPTKSKPFPSLFSTLTSNQSTTSSSPQHASDCSSNTTNQREAPYSVDAVLRSVKAVGNVSLSHRTGLMPISYSASSNLAPSFDSDKDPKPFSDSPDHNKKVLCSENQVIESNEPTEKITKLNRPNCQGTSCQIITFHSLTSTSYKEEDGLISHLENPAKRELSDKVKRGLLPFPSTTLEKVQCSKTKEAMKGDSVVLTSSHLPRDRTASQNPMQSLNVCDPVIDSENHKCKGGPPVQPPKALQKAFHNLFASPLVPSSTQHSEHSPDTSLNITDHQGKIAVPAEPPSLFASLFASPLTHKPAPKQSIQLSSHPPEIPPDTKGCTEPPKCAGQTKPDCESKQAHDASSGSNKPMKRPFQNLDSISTPSSQESAPSSSTLTQHIDKGILCSLFAIPVNEATAPLASPQGKPESPETLLAGGTGKNCTEASSPDSRPSKRSRSQNVHETSATQDSKRRQQQPSGILSEKASSETTRTNSVLKNLFLHLSPYCHAGAQQQNIQSSFSESGKHGRSIGPGPREEVEKRIEHQSKNEVTMPEESERPFSPRLQGSSKLSNPLTTAAPDISKSQPSRLNPHISTRFIQDQARTPGVHHLPIKAVMLIKQPPSRPTLDGKVGSTSLKNLFMGLDVTASPFGP